MHLPSAYCTVTCSCGLAAGISHLITPTLVVLCVEHFCPPGHGQYLKTPWSSWLRWEPEVLMQTSGWRPSCNAQDTPTPKNHPALKVSGVLDHTTCSVETFLGFISYLRNFIPWSMSVSVIHNLTPAALSRPPPSVASQAHCAPIKMALTQSSPNTASTSFVLHTASASDGIPFPLLFNL